MTRSTQTAMKRRSRADEVAEDLDPISAAAGLALGNGRTAPEIHLGGPISPACREIAAQLRRVDIFRRGTGASAQIITVGEDGAMREMVPLRFCSWIEQHVSFVQATKGGERPVPLSSEMAAKILASDEFRNGLRPLKSVMHVRLPVWANDARTEVRLLPAGYDDQSQTFTVDKLKYEEDMDINDAWDFLLEVYAGYPFAESGELASRRSLGVQMGAHYAIFCKNLLADGTRPLFAYAGNQPGLGKTGLLKLAINAVHGSVSLQSFPGNEDELGKALTVAAVEGHDYICYDNVKGFLSSGKLEGWVTSVVHTGRELGKTASVTALNQSVVFVTGNNFSLSPDLARRACIVDLFLPGEPKDRIFSQTIDDLWIGMPDVRRRFLAAMWAGLRFWQEKRGCSPTPGLVLQTFENFSRIIGGIVMGMGFADPMARPEVSLDEVGEAWRRLLAALADGVPDGGSLRFTPGECLERAEEMDLLDDITGAARDARKAFGQRIKKWQGRKLMDNRGRQFEFGRRQRSNTGSGYEIKIS